MFSLGWKGFDRLSTEDQAEMKGFYNDRIKRANKAGAKGGRAKRPHRDGRSNA